MLKKTLLVVGLGTFLVASDAEVLAEKKCGECHVMGVTSKEKIDNMKAPPYWAIAKKVREAYDTHDKQVDFIVDYSLNPAKEKMLFPEQTIKMFGVMPSQEGKVTKDELKLISTYILGE